MAESDDHTNGRLTNVRGRPANVRGRPANARPARRGAGVRVRTYGTCGPPVVVLHGGPGAPGYMASVARELAGSFRVLEPLQRGSGGEPLTVARHVADLHQVVESYCGGSPPALVGHSWGAMLALAYSATHPGCAVSLVLIGCGTFDPTARARLRAICEERMSDDLRRRLERLPDEFPDPDERLRVMGDLLLPLYSYRPVRADLGGEACDARAHHETWADMLRLQEGADVDPDAPCAIGMTLSAASGVYPAAFSAIDAPVIMLHGAFDPHPGRMIRASLKPYLPQLEYHEWERCGHYPWLERAVRDDFFTFLRGWLARRFAEEPTTSPVSSSNDTPP